MKIVFAGTPEFAAQAMRAIYDAGHEIVLALTQPDRRAGRGMHLQASPVKEFALQKNIPVLQPETLRITSTDPQKQAQAAAANERLSSIDFDVMVVVAYGLILPQEVLDISERAGRHGSFNIHASLLPRWRGAAPIQRAIESGDPKTGVCIMQMDAGLDTGDTVLVAELEIARDETSASLHDRLAELGSKSIVDVLNALEQDKNLSRVPQEKDGITYAEKILKSEAEIDWALSAKEIDQRIRAFNPFPGASSNLNGLAVKFWDSRLADPKAVIATGTVGEVLGFGNKGAYIQCGEGVLEVLEMQKPGGKKIDAKTCLQPIGVGEKLLRFKTKE
ncbi:MULTISPECIES: methionyl-tRNA formyltransferase [unclassified Polynucleobacter]|uniref:methionyl-tRNA formyltransferase n=1 Tax=unclassified Polynucleobacter TaxID=2640945 RepID=UPI001BFEC594|nr:MULTISPECIES: methionyl-tRNA formyltransferase [unclassified Polynucleobacter]MBU3547512.1 methionyl-tRNA formyltransferase [Polynucleobacter sp. P1-05-14]MEA9568227.1 methionyl-tRNA formyltransferase [Polynucleobacter sp. AP-Nickl1-40-C4]QWD81618.1 methionyl-tRNA formyltransferase [Polynucleobacter sp. MWH-S4W17]